MATENEKQSLVCAGCCRSFDLIPGQIAQHTAICNHCGEQFCTKCFTVHRRIHYTVQMTIGGEPISEPIAAQKKAKPSQASAAEQLQLPFPEAAKSVKPQKAKREGKPEPFATQRTAAANAANRIS